MPYIDLLFRRFCFALHLNLILKQPLRLSNGSNVNTVREETETPLILGARYKKSGNAISSRWLLEEYECLWKDNSDAVRLPMQQLNEVKFYAW